MKQIMSGIGFLEQAIQFSLRQIMWCGEFDDDVDTVYDCRNLGLHNCQADVC